MRLFVSPQPVLYDADSPFGDFCCTDEGELLALWCCPCDDKSTLGAVGERGDITPAILLDLFRNDLIRRGFYSEIDSDDEVENWLADMVIDVQRAAIAFEPGSLVRYNGKFALVDANGVT
jgi:hypothetical protein